MAGSGTVEQIKRSFQYLTNEYEFAVIEERSSPQLFGNALVRYRSTTVDITITVDRGQVFVDFTPAFDVSRRTYGLSVLIDYLASENLQVDQIVSRDSNEHDMEVIRQINHSSQILRQCCSSLLLGQFTGWEYLGVR